MTSAPRLRPEARQFDGYVRTAGIGAVIVEQAWADPWMSIFGKLGLAERVGRRVTIYSTGVKPAAGHQR